MKARPFTGQDKLVRHSVQIARVDTKNREGLGKVLDIEDATFVKRKADGDIDLVGKVRFNLVVYDANKQKPSQWFIHCMDLDEFLLMCLDIATLMRKIDPYYVAPDGADPKVAKPPYQVQEYKGSKDPKSPTGVSSSILTVAFVPTLGRDSKTGICRGAYSVMIQNGPGIANETGAVMPSKEHPQSKDSMILPIAEARKMCRLAEHYFQAKMTSLLTRNWKELFDALPAPDSSASAA